MSEQEEPDPRFDPAYQRGFGGGTDRRTSAERAFARPDATVDARTERARAVRPAGPEPTPPPVVVPPADEPDALPAPDPTVAPVAVAAAEHPPLRTNPWFLAMLGLGVLGSVVGYAVLYWALATPISAFSGSDTSTNAYVLHQMLFYISVPLLGCFPVAVLVALGLVAARWSGRTPTPARPDEDDAAEVTVA